MMLLVHAELLQVEVVLFFSSTAGRDHVQADEAMMWSFSKKLKSFIS